MYDKFKTRSKFWGETARESFVNKISHNFGKFLEQGLATSILLDGKETPAIVTSLKDAETQEEKVLLLESSYYGSCKVGSIVLWNDQNYLVVNHLPDSFEDSLAPYLKFIIAKTHTTLTWQNVKGKLVSTFVVVKTFNDKLTSAVRQVIPVEVGNSSTTIMLPAIREFARNDRILLNKRAYKVDGINDFQAGIVYLILSDDLLVDTDNTTLGVANYFDYTKNFSLFFLEGANIVGTPISTLSPTPRLLEGGVVVNTVATDYVWTSNNPKVSVVNGAIVSTEGTPESAIVTISLKENPLITTHINVAFEAAPAPVATTVYSVLGPDSLKLRTSATYSLSLVENGVEQIPTGCTFAINTGAEFVDMITITPSVQFKLTASGNKVGTVVINVLDSTSTIVASKVVFIKTLWA